MPFKDPPKETTTRLALEPSYSFEEGAVFALLADGGVMVSVSDIQAVDSYNDSFTCKFSMTPDQAIQLRDWLISLNMQKP